MTYLKNSNTYVNKMLKPTSNAKLIPLTTIALAGAGAEIINEDNNDQINYKMMIPKNMETINAWQFLKLYTVSGIPIVDFFFIYVILYVINSIYLHYNYKLVLLLTIPITIIYNIITNKKLEISVFMVVSIIVSAYFLFTTKF